MSQVDAELIALAQHLNFRRESILLAWRVAVKRDPQLTTGDALPREDLRSYPCAARNVYTGAH
jgi:hypothetical protein